MDHLSCRMAVIFLSPLHITGQVKISYILYILSDVSILSRMAVIFLSPVHITGQVKVSYILYILSDVSILNM